MLRNYTSCISKTQENGNQQKERKACYMQFYEYMKYRENWLPLVYINIKMSYNWHLTDSVLCQKRNQANRASKKSPKF